MSGAVELKALTYTSWARPGIQSAEVEAVLESSRVNNPLEGITGLLIFNGVAFMQILEGGEAAIDELVTKLAADPRHWNMSIRDRRAIASRAFPSWSMAYLRLDDGEFVGEEAVKKALTRDLPPSIRNVVMGLTHSILRDAPGA